jgi:two-component sensor histidine kinase
VEERLQTSLQEKEALLKEIHHRVKNNLQIISSLLNLQTAHLKDPAALTVLAESQNRVRAMGLVHETLYGSENLGRVDVARYLESLCASLFRAFGVDPGRVRLQLRVADVPLDLDRAIPCGLLVNELVSNSLKYAFPAERRGQVVVELCQSSPGACTLVVADDGVGLPPDLDFRQTSSLGLQLVCGLAQQLGAIVELERTQGARFAISFCLESQEAGDRNP